MLDNLLEKHNKELLGTLTREQRIEQTAVLKMMELMKPSDKIKLTKLLIEYYKSKYAFSEMVELTEAINKYLADNRDYNKLEEKILGLPKDRLILPEDKDTKEIYEDYKESIYNLVLYLNFKGNRDLLNKSDEIREIVESRATFDHNNITLEKMGKPTVDKDTELKPYITSVPVNSTSKALKEIYVYKNKDNIMLGEFTEEINKKKIEIAGVKGDVTSNKEKLKSIGKKIALYTTLYVGIFIGSTTLGSFVGKSIMEKEATLISNVKVTTDFEDKTHTKNLDIYDVILRTKMLRSYLDKERKYVTVFGDTVNNEFDVKVYDYTDTNLTDEELRTIELDSNNLIYDSIHKVEDLHEKESLYGIYTGEAHRDISTVNFYSKFTNPGSNKNYEEDANWAMFIGVVIANLLSFAFLSGLTLESIKDTMRDYKLGRIDKYRLLNKLQRLIEDLEVLQVKEELNKELNKLYTEQSVDNELNEYTTITR